MFRKLKRLFDSRFIIRYYIGLFAKNNLKGKNYSTVVDVGSGKSPYKYLLDCNNYIMVDNEKRIKNDQIVYSDLNKKLELDSDIADLVILTEVLEHIREPEICLKEINRVLKRSGVLVLTTPFLWPLHEKPNDFYRYTLYGIEYLLAKSGFKIVKIENNGGYFSTILQILQLNMRNKFFLPIVFVINVVALIFIKFEKSGDLYLSNQCVAKKI